MNPLIELRAASFAPAGVRNIHMSARPGECVSVVGPNGGGKTTILKMAVGLLRPTDGEAFRAPKLRTGYMPQTLSPDWTMPMTAGDFIALRGKCGKQALAESLESCGLPDDILRRPLRALSGGELRRLALARLLADDDLDLLALDEPTQGMDVWGESDFYGVVEKFMRDNPRAGALIVSHDVERVMARSDHVYCVNGDIRCHGAGDEVIRDPALPASFRARIGLYRHNHRRNPK